jgi:hypothetical protein
MYDLAPSLPPASLSDEVDAFSRCKARTNVHCSTLVSGKLMLKSSGKNYKN